MANRRDAGKRQQVDVEPRGAVGRLERLPTLTLESLHDFMTDVMRFANSDLAVKSRNRALELAKQAGRNPGADIPIDEAMKLFRNDPAIRIQARVWHTAHNYEHAVLDAAFHADAETYLAEMSAYDKAAPGKLILDPSLKLPDYTRHEIHQQPGGYVGNDFAGHIYHYATNQFYRGANDQDERHRAYAANCPTPGDGKVLRILDLGCGIGQLAVTMKERFPNAEVHGIDCAAPMLRYAHMRAVDLNADVTFAQRLAEETLYPDNHFDIVVSYILFHEVTAEACQRIIAETHRIVRPGGIFYPLDFNPKPTASAPRIYSAWMDHRWNNEPWRLEYASVDFGGEMKKAGFTVDDNSKGSGTFGNITGTKMA